VVRIAGIALVALAACGRFDFDTVTTGSDAGSGSDDVGVKSCASLPKTCGPTQSSTCCASPIVDGGTFFRGYDKVPDTDFKDMSKPATVSSFRLDKYETTVGRFRAFVDAGYGTQAKPPVVGSGGRTLNGMANQGAWEAAWTSSLTADRAALDAALHCDTQFSTWTPTAGANESRPLNCVNWYEAMAFCIWDGGFLPTEAETMYAAAGGDEQRAYPWSNPPDSLVIDTTQASVNCLGDGVNGCELTDMTVPGTKPAGDGRWGQSELLGNVWEWTVESISDYTTPCVDCASIGGIDIIVRGAGWDDGVTSTLRVGHRETYPANGRLANSVAIRCARPL
jgi:formylglycine-generating enzyme required for sulfatase activity